MGSIVRLGVSFETYVQILHRQWSQIWLKSLQPGQVCWMGLPIHARHVASRFECYAGPNRPKVFSGQYACALPEALPFPEASFDCVVCAHAHEGKDEGRVILSEAARIVRSQGHVLVFSFTPGRLVHMQSIFKYVPAMVAPPFLSMDQIQDCFKAEGLACIKRIPLLYRPYCRPAYFKACSWLEIIGPLMIPFSANLELSVWRKDESALILDEQQCQVWSE